MARKPLRSPVLYTLPSGELRPLPSAPATIKTVDGSGLVSVYEAVTGGSPLPGSVVMVDNGVPLGYVEESTPYMIEVTYEGQTFQDNPDPITSLGAGVWEIAGPVNDETFSEAADRDAINGDTAFDWVNSHFYVRSQDRWNFTRMVPVVESITITPPGQGLDVGAPFPSGAVPITFTFSEAVEAGRFANGDWYVIGPVEVVAMTPAFSAGQNGYDVNPTNIHGEHYQSFDNRISGYVAPSRSLPFVVQPNESLIKVVAEETDVEAYHNLGVRFAAVLTVLGEHPPANSMRPPYVGTHKPIIPAVIDTSQFAEVDVIDELPTVAYAKRFSQPFRLQYNSSSVIADAIAATDATCEKVGEIFEWDMRCYAPNEWTLNESIIMVLNSSGPTLAEKKEIAINYAQHGIDLYGATLVGFGGGASQVRGGGGNGAGLLMTTVFAATALQNEEMLTWLAALTDDEKWWEFVSYQESDHELVEGLALWGQEFGFPGGPTPEEYWWQNFDHPEGTGGNTMTQPDPYLLIDGGYHPGGSYQDTTSHQMGVLAALMDVMPTLRSAWPDHLNNNNIVWQYGHRWMQVGTWTIPDDAEPKTFDVDGDDYGVIYGNDGLGSYFKHGGDVLTDGRWPERHGYNIAGGNRFTQVGQNWYDAYATPPFRLTDDTAILDDFTGADGPVDTGIWDPVNILFAPGLDDALEIESNKLSHHFDGLAPDAGNIVTVVTLPVDVGVTVDMKTIDTDNNSYFYVALRITDNDPFNGVSMGWDNRPDKEGWHINPFVGGVLVDEELITYPGTIPVVDEQLSFVVQGSRGSILRRTTPYGPWTVVASRNDLPNLVAGKAAVLIRDFAFQCDNFRVTDLT